jgi:hypothetical protein
MRTIVGVFRSRVDAQRTAARLDEVGIAQSRIKVLTPEASAEELQQIPTVEGEQPGMGAALGATLGSAMGLAGGASIGSIIAAAFVPGIGPVLALGLAGTTIGLLGGAAVGSTLERDIFVGLPQEELYVYQDALRQGRSVLVALAEDHREAEQARSTMEQGGAESVNRAREMWWIGLRDIEKEHYEAHGGDFSADEADFRAGFEAAQDPSFRGVHFEESKPQLRERFPKQYDHPAFRAGFERGCVYCDTRKRKSHAAD